VYEVRISTYERYVKTRIFNTFKAALSFVDEMNVRWGNFYTLVLMIVLGYILVRLHERYCRKEEL
jgi:hypothetical protein